jgi:hypothetical protein
MVRETRSSAMTYFSDLQPCTYFDRHGAVLVASRNVPLPMFSGPLLAIGWLEMEHDFARGSCAPKWRTMLGALVEHRLQRSNFLGDHLCSVCRYAERRDPVTSEIIARIARGRANVFVPGEGLVYVTPELILHYIDAHGYRPPDVFCSAVETCPPIGSEAYFARLDLRGRLPSFISAP